MPKYTVVENAGYEGERDVRTFDRYRDALAWIIAGYAEDERDRFHVTVAVDREDGSRSYGC